MNLDMTVKSETIINEMLERLAKLSSCEISDALIKSGISSGGLLTDIRMYSPRLVGDTLEHRIVGRAYTVKMIAASDPDKTKPSGHFVDSCPPGYILLMQTPTGVKSGCWGGLMSVAAKTKGILGVVIDGGCRDVSEHQAIKFPVCARSQSTLGPSSFTRPFSFGESLTIHPLPPHSTPPHPSTTVNPGDILVCDQEGCVSIPINIVEAVVEEAERAAAVDEKVRQDLEAGKGVSESFLKWRGKAP